MEWVMHTGRDGDPIGEIIADTILIQNEQDGNRLLEEVFGSGAYKVILHQENLAPAFFDLSTGLAGNVLQKFVNYNVQAAIVGDFRDVPSKSLHAFIVESNRGRHVCFVDTIAAAMDKLSSGSH